MSFFKQDLQAYVEQDSVLRSMRNNNDFTGMALELNTRTRTEIGSVSAGQFLMWLAASDMTGKVEDLSLDPTSPFRSSALALKWAMFGDISLDVGDSTFQSLMQAWAEAELLNPAYIEQLNALATVKKLVFTETFTESSVREVFGN